jgi:uncharacterized protein DUF6787
MTEIKGGFLKKLQDRWGVSASRVLIILVVFALTGTTVLFIKTPILDFIVGEDVKTWVHSLVYFILILPIYNILLLIYGSLFGQFQFFWDFEKRFFRRIFFLKKNAEAD